MKKIIATLSLVFALTLGINASAQTRTISVEVMTYDGSLFDRCIATVQVRKAAGIWVDRQKAEVYGVKDFSFRFTLHRDSVFRVRIRAKQDQIENINYSREYLMSAAPNTLWLRVEFYIARSNYVLLEEGDEGYNINM